MLDGIDRDQPFTLVFDGVEQVGPRFALLVEERFEFEAVFGATVMFSAVEPRTQRWVVRAPSEAGAAPQLEWHPESRTLTSFAADTDGFLATLNALHTLAWSPTRSVTSAVTRTAAAAAERVRDEVAASFPSLGLRQLDWEELSRRHFASVSADDAGFAARAAEWVAQLGDAHTHVRRIGATYNPPYRGTLHEQGVELSEVPAGSPAAQSGVAAGWTVEVTDPGAVWRSTGASPQHRRQVAARRALAVTGADRLFTARDPGRGRIASWLEIARPVTLDDVVQVARDDTGALLLRLRSFHGGVGLADVFDDLLRDAAASEHLTLDLRGNPGGSLLAATDLRDRFLHERTQLGTIRFTTGTGTLAEPRPLIADPSQRPRWPGRLTVLVDEMTYSAAEDFVLGLQGLDHVKVRGRRTGGGSGRPRSIPLTDDLILSVSTALTFDRTGRCVEHNGLLPDPPHS